MKTLVEELQQKLLDHHLSTLESLRLALYVAKKLKLSDLEEWVNAELNGYKDPIKIPSYRHIPCQLKGWKNIRNRWESISFEETEKENLFSKTPIGQGIDELEHLCSRKLSHHDGLKIHLSKDLEAQIIKGLYPGIPPSEVALILDVTHIKGIVEKVRSLLLSWSLDLESAGVKGEGMNFSDKEREAAKGVSITNNYHAEAQTIVQEMKHSNIMQANRVSSQSFMQKAFDAKLLIKMVEEISAQVELINLSINQKSEIKSDLTTLHSQATSSNPKFSIIKESLLSLKNIFENATGECAAAIFMKISGFISLMNIG